MRDSGLNSLHIEELREVVADILGVDSSELRTGTGEGSIDEWDSLAHLSIVTAVEEKYGVKFHMEEIQRTRNLSALAEALSARLAA